MMTRTVVTAIVIAMFYPASARAAQSFIYAAVAAPPCSSATCASGQLLVLDSVTHEIVTTAPLGTAQNVPQGMAIAPDGSRLYVSLLASDGSTSLYVFDTSTHQPVASYPIAPATAGAVAVTRDSKRVFIAGNQLAPGSNRLAVWDAQSATVTGTQLGDYDKLFAHPAFARVIGATLSGTFVGLDLFALDEVAGGVIASKDEGFGWHVTMSPDGSRIYNTHPNWAAPSSGISIKFYSPNDLNQAGTIASGPAPFAAYTLDAPNRNRLYVLHEGAGRPASLPATAPLGNR
jgi:DNA-binding beta-propeller fold protein YncE